MSNTVLNPFPRNVQVKAVQRRVLQHDLDMFAAIAGKRNGISAEEFDTEHHDDPITHLPVRRSAKPWSTSVLASYLGNFNMPRISVRVVRPEMADWLKRLSSQAIERLAEAQVRIAATRQHAQRSRESRSSDGGNDSD